MSEERNERIRHRAYLLWEANGAEHGSDWDFWLQAEAEILAEDAPPSAATGPLAAPEPAAEAPAEQPASKPRKTTARKATPKAAASKASPTKAASAKAAASPAKPRRTRKTTAKAGTPITETTDN